jgi:hypothetical protein
MKRIYMTRREPSCFWPPVAGRFPRMTRVWVDSAYRDLSDWVKATLGWNLEVVRHWWTGVKGGVGTNWTRTSGFTQWVSRPTPAMGSGTDLWVVRVEPADVQRL